MDLALHLGMTVGEIERDMSGVELGLWVRRAERRALPWRRVELHLAQIAMQVARLSGSGASLSDFLLDPPDDPSTTDGSEDAAEYFGFSPRNNKE
mgnify:CR=1 FL=1